MNRNLRFEKRHRLPTILLVTIAMLLLSGGLAHAGTTMLEVQNSTSLPVTVWVTLGAVSGCATLNDLPFITHQANPSQGSFQIASGNTQIFPTDKGCLNGNITFSVPPNNCSPAGGPANINLFEFNLNNGQESIDISGVAGFNSLMDVILTGGGPWNANGSDVSSFSNIAGDNLGRSGVFPLGCTNCINNAGKPGCIPDSPCNTEHICTVNRVAASAGGTVKVTITGFINQ